MDNRRPPAVLLTAAWQLVIGSIWLFQAMETPGAIYRLLLASVAVSHFVAAAGLYLLAEWGRQRAVQLAVLDVLRVIPVLLAGNVTPFGALLQIGMPLYTWTALNERGVRRRFS